MSVFLGGGPSGSGRVRPNRSRLLNATRFRDGRRDSALRRIAADVAIAVGAVLAVTEPCANGLGGDLLALHYCPATRKVSSVMGNGASPAQLDPRRFPADPLSADAVTVPGIVRAWADISARRGRLALSAALAPAIRLARDGFPVGPRTARAWAGESGVAALAAGGGGSLLIDGRAPHAGEVFTNSDLAGVLAAIARDGSDAFYSGRVAHAICEAVQHRGSFLSLDDLSAHRTRFEDSVCSTYRGLNVHECGFPSHGPAALLMLNIAETFDLGGLSHGGADATHTLVECARLAFAEASAYVGDSATGAARAAGMLDKAFATGLASRIGDRRCEVNQGGSLPAGGTVQFCVVDAGGDAWSVVQSNCRGFGGGIGESSRPLYMWM